jgi:hypothetical protein
MVILLIPLILINYIRNLKLLAPFSSVANIITFIGLGMILAYIFEDLPQINEREMFGSVRNFSLYFGTTLFALEAVGVVSKICMLLFSLPVLSSRTPFYVQTYIYNKTKYLNFE